MRRPIYALAGGAVGAVTGSVVCFGIALVIQTIVPLDTPPDFYLPVGIAVGMPLGGLLAVRAT